MTGLSRRGILAGGAAAGASTLLLAGCTREGGRDAGAASAELTPEKALRHAPIGTDTAPFHGAHQAGVETEAQAFVSLIALDLDDGAKREAIRRLLWVLTAVERR